MRTRGLGIAPFPKLQSGPYAFFRHQVPSMPYLMGEGMLLTRRSYFFVQRNAMRKLVERLIR